MCASYSASFIIYVSCLILGRRTIVVRTVIGILFTCFIKKVTSCSYNLFKGAVYSAHLLLTRNYFTSIDKETHTLYIYKTV